MLPIAEAFFLESLLLGDNNAVFTLCSAIIDGAESQSSQRRFVFNPRSRPELQYKS